MQSIIVHPHSQPAIFHIFVCHFTAVASFPAHPRGGAGVQHLDWRGCGAGAKGAGGYFIGATIVKLCLGIVVVCGASLLPVGWDTTGGGAKD